MANNSRCRHHAAQTGVVRPAAAGPTTPEPPVRRWPHPVDGVEPSRQSPDPTLHYIRCALSYQNQVLADIKALLEKVLEKNDC